jgi:perosamine synthetase
MSSLQAALGLAQLERIDDLVAKKRRIFNWYQENLQPIEEITLNYEAPDTKNTYWMVTAIIDKKLGLNKERLMQLMSKKNIDCRPFFHPLSSIPAYEHLQQAKQAKQRNNTSYEISPFGINLPSALNLTTQDVKFVCDSLKSVLGL